ncbi:hypothetical protein, partial [Nostoc sp.]|uniref:hypothetical protein n=1 Tax=Nostoc sp. TaxID=1180 RepID=UPI002FFC00C2
MHTSELFRLYVSAQKSVHQSTLIEANLAKAIHSDTKPHDGDIPFIAQYGSVKAERLISDMKFRSFNSLSSTSMFWLF